MIRAWHAMAAIALLLAAMSLFISAVLVRHQTTRLEEASFGVCKRLQLQRERVNLSEARQYLILSNASRNPATPRKIRRNYRVLADTTEYGPPTDCHQAVEDPPHYKAPGVRAYSQLGAAFARRITVAAEHHQPPPEP